jgi:hypothetical protein
MRGLEAALPPEFSLLKSEFNDFLFAPIGEEKNNALLTVLSALVRLGIDPWQESARLAQLSTDMATQRLTSIISGLPNGRWAPSDAGAIAARLINLLPAKRSAASPLRATAPARHPASSWLVMLLFVAVVGGLTFFAMTNHPRPTATVDTSGPSLSQ